MVPITATATALGYAGMDPSIDEPLQRRSTGV